MNKFISALVGVVLAGVMGGVAWAGATVPPQGQTVGDKLRTNSGVGMGHPPITMASPPTVAQFTTEQLAGGSGYLWNDPAVTLLGAVWSQVGANSRAKPITICYDGATCSGSAGSPGANSGSIYFESDAPVVELVGLYQYYRIYVDLNDGQGWQIVGTQSSGNTGVNYFVTITFAGSTPVPRKYRIDCDVSTQFSYVQTAATYSLWKYQRPSTQQLVVMGDSFAEGSGATYPSQDGYIVQLGLNLGIDDTIASGSGGTGLVQTNGGRVNYKDRIANLLTQFPTPTYFFVQTTENDDPFSAATVEANLLSVLQAVAAASPGTRLGVIGVWNTSQTNATAAALDAALSAWCASNGYLYLPWYTFITGTGYAGHTTGDGNGDYYVASDHVHPSTAGHFYRSVRVKDLIRSIFSPTLP